MRWQACLTLSVVSCLSGLLHCSLWWGNTLQEGLGWPGGGGPLKLAVALNCVG